MRPVIPTAIIAVGALLAADRVVQPTTVSSPQSLLPRGGPIKILGIPAPDEWIDIESNAIGQPPTVYVVPDKHRLTLTSIAQSPHFGSPGFQRMSMRVSIDGIVYFEVAEITGANVARADTPVHWSVLEGLVLQPGQTLTVERLDNGVLTSPANDTFTFTVRGFLEKVE